MTPRPRRQPDDGPVRTTRQDWLAVATDLLVREGAAAVKVLSIAQRLGCSRSSFYWFFASRDDLLDALLQAWGDRNTHGIIDRAGAPAPTVSAAVLNVFECWADPALFDYRLDFAVREWARRSDKVLDAVRAADTARLAALTAMFARYGMDRTDAVVRARTLYFTQIGYYALDVQESDVERLALLESYVATFSGERPDPADASAFAARVFGRMPFDKGG